MTAPDTDAPLRGVGVLVTRPRDQAGPLCDKVRAAGGKPILFPALEIGDVADLVPLRDLIARLHTFDIAIFISPNAVLKAINLIRAQRDWPTNVQIAAVGRGSARELNKLGLPATLVPQDRYDSEALLELPALQTVRGQRIVIFRGEGGRELLAQTLTARGATVEYAECYRRLPPSGDVGVLLYQWARGEIDVAIVTSNEALHNLIDAVGKLGGQWLRDTPLVVVGARQAELARELAFKYPAIISARADDDAIVAALCAWRNGNLAKINKNP